MIFPPRKPRDPAVLGMLPITAFGWPLTYTYLVQADFGQTQLSLSVDAPICYDNTAACVRLGRLLYGAVVAPATSDSTTMYAMFMTQWKVSPISQPHGVSSISGQRMGSATGRDESPQLVLLAGDHRQLPKRRLFLPGVPRGWVSGGMLTRDGFEQIMQQARGLIMGMGALNPGGTVSWLLPYPGVLEPTGDNLQGVAFGRVEHVRVCQHTDKAPEPSGIGGL